MSSPAPSWKGGAFTPAGAQGGPTIVDKQVWPQASLLQDQAGGGGWGGHLALGDVKAQPSQQPHQVRPRLLRLIGAKSHLQPGPFQPAEGRQAGEGAVSRQPSRPGRGVDGCFFSRGTVQSKPGLHGLLNWASTASPDPGVSELEKTLLILAELGTPETPSSHMTSASAWLTGMPFHPGHTASSHVLIRPPPGTHSTPPRTSPHHAAQPGGGPL